MVSLLVMSMVTVASGDSERIGRWGKSQTNSLRNFLLPLYN